MIWVKHLAVLLVMAIVAAMASAEAGDSDFLVIDCIP